MILEFNLDVAFKTAKMMKLCNGNKSLQKKYGINGAKLIRRRLDELKAARVLSDIAQLPGPRCHELTGDKKGSLSVDVEHPYRLIFIPDNDPIPRKKDGGLDWDKVTKIKILGVEDTHGK